MNAQLSYHSTNQDHRRDDPRFVRSKHQLQCAFPSPTAIARRAHQQLQAQSRTAPPPTPVTTQYVPHQPASSRANLNRPSRNVLQTARYAYDLREPLGRSTAASVRPPHGRTQQPNQLVNRQRPTRLFAPSQTANVTSMRENRPPAPLIDHQAVARPHLRSLASSCRRNTQDFDYRHRRQSEHRHQDLRCHRRGRNFRNARIRFKREFNSPHHRTRSHHLTTGTPEPAHQNPTTLTAKKLNCL